MNDWWDRYDHDPSTLDNIYEREFADDLNPFNQLYDDDDDENDPVHQIHYNHNHEPIISQTQSQFFNSQSDSHTQTYPQAQLHSQSLIQIHKNNCYKIIQRKMKMKILKLLIQKSIHCNK